MMIGQTCCGDRKRKAMQQTRCRTAMLLQQPKACPTIADTPAVLPHKFAQSMTTPESSTSPKTRVAHRKPMFKATALGRTSGPAAAAVLHCADWQPLPAHTHTHTPISVRRTQGHSVGLNSAATNTQKPARCFEIALTDRVQPNNLPRAQDLSQRGPSWYQKAAANASARHARTRPLHTTACMGGPTAEGRAAFKA